MDLAGAAAAAKALAGRAEGSLASDCARAGAREFRAELDVTTPVRSGRLRDSMQIMSVSGGGTVAVAVVGSDLIYAHFRNYGGTITRHGPGSLGTPAVGFFGHSVTQSGSHYMERAEAEALETMDAAMRAILAEFLTL